MTLQPELYEPDERLPRDLVVLRRFARLMDEAVTIPGINRKVGLDAAIGLIPGFGDVAGAILSSWVLIGAVRHRVPIRVLLRMIFNILIDVTVGAIPILGDIFDFFWEENVMNVDLLFKHRHRAAEPRNVRQMSVVALLLVGTVIAVMFAFLLAALWFVVVALRSR